MKSRVRSTAVIVHNQKILGFRAIDPTTKKEYFFLPGGAVEPDETATDAAERETLEETGYEVGVDFESAIDREYFFNWDGEDYDCLTIFYWGVLLSPMQRQVVNEPGYNRGVEWVPLADLGTALGYSAEIRSAVEELLQKYNQA